METFAGVFFVIIHKKKKKIWSKINIANFRSAIYNKVTK